MSCRHKLWRRVCNQLDVLQDSQRESSLVYSSQQMSVWQRHSGYRWRARSQNAQVSAVGERLEALDWLAEAVVDLANFRSTKLIAWWYQLLI